MSKRTLIVAALLALLGGCSFPNDRFDVQLREQLANGGDEFATALYQSTRAPMHSGNRVELVENGAVFDAIEEQIERAQQSIHVVAYIWRDSAPSKRLVDAILDRTRHGVACRIVYDPLGSPGFVDQVRKTLSDGGCDVRAFRPFGPGEWSRVQYRTHRKLVVIDGRVGITGGFGIWKSWEGDGLHPEQWRDDALVVEGPVVREMQLTFAEDWQESGGPLLGEKEFPELRPDGPANAAFVSSQESVNDSEAARMYQVLIAAAHQRLWIANSYFIPSKAISDRLIEKAKQGVDVRILVPGKFMDIPPIRIAQHSTYERLLKGGVKIWEYGPSMLHTKVVLVDDRLVSIGSTNMDPLSLKKNEEGSLVIEDPELASEVHDSFEDDLEHSMEIRWDSWRRGGLAEGFLQHLVGTIGGWL